jgi:hypothetical protein
MRLLFGEAQMILQQLVENALAGFSDLPIH